MPYKLGGGGGDQIQNRTEQAATNDRIHTWNTSEGKDESFTWQQLWDDLWAILGNILDNVLQRAELKDYAETASIDSSSGAAKTIDLEDANVHDVKLTANCTLTFSNPPASGKGGSFTLILRQDGSGSRTVTWPASVKWPSGTEPTLATDANDLDVLSFVTVSGGSTWLGFHAGGEFS
jgi:hypothetical protein